MSSSGFTLNSFLSQMDHASGFARSDRYEVWISTANLFANMRKLRMDYWELFNLPSDYEWMPRLIMFCEAAELPGFQFTTEKARIYGPEFSIPTMAQFQDINLSFYVGADMWERFFFDAWMFSIGDAFKNDFNYISEYATTIDIAQYNDQNQCSYVSRLIDAYPIAINQMPLSYGNDGQIHKLGVTLTYKFAGPIEVTEWRGSTVESRTQDDRSRGARQSFDKTITTKNPTNETPKDNNDQIRPQG